MSGKTELIFFHSKRHSLNYDDLSIKFNGIKLFTVDYVKYLDFTSSVVPSSSDHGEIESRYFAHSGQL